MTQPDTRQTTYQNKVNSLNAEILSLTHILSNTEGRVNSFEEKLSRIPSRLSRVRSMNYKIFTSLEKDQASLAERWNMIAPGLKERIHSVAVVIRSEIRGLESEINMRRLDRGGDITGLSSLDGKISMVRMRINELSSSVSSSISQLENGLQVMDHDIQIAESTVTITSQASFPWKDDETPILAVNAKDMKNDLEGFLTMTNQRIIFESEKEIVLKKTLFIATEKKKVRELVLERPIGIIDNMTKGRVGLLAGHGLYIEFKPNSGIPEMKLDTKGYEADWALRFYGLVTSGVIDQELNSLSGAEKKAPIEPLVCKRCGAPYTSEIYRGQTSVQCKYCGSVIPV